MFIVPICRAHAQVVLEGTNTIIDGNHWYWYIRNDNECYGVMSNGVVDGGYWAYERDYIRNKSYWLKIPYKTDDTLNHFRFDVSWLGRSYVWSNCRFRHNLWLSEVDPSECNWIDAAISALTSGDVNGWTTLLQHFNRTDVRPTLNKLGGITLYWGNGPLSFHSIIEDEYCSHTKYAWVYHNLYEGEYPMSLK